jgi:hypothetical protein
MSWIVSAIIRGLQLVTVEDIEALPPARRRQLADLLRHWGSVADKPSVANPHQDRENRK